MFIIMHHYLDPTLAKRRAAQSRFFKFVNSSLPLETLAEHECTSSSGPTCISIERHKQFVYRVSRSLFKETGRQVVMQNWFSSIPCNKVEAEMFASSQVLFDQATIDF